MCFLHVYYTSFLCEKYAFNMPFTSVFYKNLKKIPLLKVGNIRIFIFIIRQAVHSFGSLSMFIECLLCAFNTLLQWIFAKISIFIFLVEQ